MHLNIKNHKAHDVASQLAALTGESMTRVVMAALKEKLERVIRKERRHTAEEILAFVDSFGLTPSPGEPYPLSTRHGELLYDERGLPK